LGTGGKDRIVYLCSGGTQSIGWREKGGGGKCFSLCVGGGWNGRGGHRGNRRRHSARTISRNETRLLKGVEGILN